MRTCASAFGARTPDGVRVPKVLEFETNSVEFEKGHLEV